MKIPTRLFSLFLAGTCLASTNLVQANTESPMIGRQSHNEGIRAVPAPGTVEIDGDLSDWDLSGRIWSFADIAIRDRYSVETAAMWDTDYLYVAAKFRDPTPAQNTINPEFEMDSGWKGDALQMRLLTDWPHWVTMWHFSDEDRSVLHRATWEDADDSRQGQDYTVFSSEPGSKDLGEGIQMAFQADKDGSGYVQEIRIPWHVIYKQSPKVVAGESFRMGLEFFWGREDESVWPVHRYADNLQPGETSREFFWTAKHVWGDVSLLPEGNVEKLTYIPDVGKLEGTIPLEAVIPAAANEFTVVIESEEGKRIRNLGAQLNAEQYSVAVNEDERTVRVLWDGVDDHGTLVAPGTYNIRGLSHEGIGADYVMSFYNPGTPPWEAGSKGSWGADHGAPAHVTAAGNWTVIGWRFAEGGHGIIGVASDGLKKWGEKRGARALAGDAKNVYFMSSGWHHSGNLCRLNLKDGTYKPFVLDGKERPFELPLSEVFGDGAAVPGEVISMASSGQTLALAFAEGQIALLDPDSASLRKTIAVPAPSALAYGPGGELYAVSDGQLVEVNLENGDLRAIPTPGIQQVSASKAQDDFVLESAAAAEKTPVKQGSLTVDQDGNIGLFDKGPDQQVKFYTPEGAFAYAVGREGGRPIRGDFDEQAMIRVSSVAVDAKGQVWVTENWDFPRRVSVWGRDGKLVRDYIGNTGYAGSGTFLHDEDPTLAYYGPVEMKLDLENRTWKVTRILWVPGEGEHFRINPASHAHPHRFSSKASGQEREYMFNPPYFNNSPYVLFMEDENGWRPVSAIGALGAISGEIDRNGSSVIREPEGEFAAHNAMDGFFWNDKNGDGKVQYREVTIIPAKNTAGAGERGQPPIPIGSGWGTRMSSTDLSFTVNGVSKYLPTGFSKDGAPHFGPESIKKLEFSGRGDFVPVLEENAIIALMWEKYFGATGLYALDAKTGEPLWSYPNPYPGVHGSHRAPMPQPGLLIGPLKILGVAGLPNNNGHVFGMRGNLGQDFYFTTDGLFIGTVFQDGRLPTVALPAREKELFGAPMEAFGGGGEPFTGWFGGHEDGKIRLLSGMPRQASMVLEMNGFDSIHRFTAPPATVSELVLSQAALANAERAAAAAEQTEREYTIPHLAKAPGLDGKGKGWKEVPSFKVESSASSFEGEAQLAYDDENLYIAMNVNDPSPWMNEGGDPTRLFKTGDAVDIQLATRTDAEDALKRNEPVSGDLRVVFSQLGKKPAAVLMQPVNPDAPEQSSRVYTSPVTTKEFDEVRVLPDAQIGVQTNNRSYRIEAALPLASLGLKPEPGQETAGDIGFISSDEAGRVNIARTYWSNKNTNLVNDKPFEAWITPERWGVFIWGEAEY